MSSAVAGYVQSFGADGPPAAMKIWADRLCLFWHQYSGMSPDCFNRLQKHHKKNRNVKLIVVDPRLRQQLRRQTCI